MNSYEPQTDCTVLCHPTEEKLGILFWMSIPFCMSYLKYMYMLVAFNQTCLAMTLGHGKV